MKMFLITYISEHGAVRYETLQADVSLSSYMERWHSGRPYTLKEVEFPEPPKPILRPDWTRKIGASWKAENFIYTLAIDCIAYINTKTLVTGHMTVPGDSDYYWNTITRLPKED